MLRSRPKESNCVEPSDQLPVFPSKTSADSMNFPFKFIGVMAIGPWIAVLLLCGYSGAAPTSPHKKCRSDYECNPGEFCRQKFGASYCVPCLDCSSYNREPRSNCARSRTDCGRCLEGFGPLGEHCSRHAKENETTHVPNQASKNDQEAIANPAENYSVWLLACVPAILALVVMTSGAVVYTCRRGVHGATNVPEDQIELAPLRPSAPALSNLSKNANSLGGPPEAWANPHIRKSSTTVPRVHREQPAQTGVIPKCHNLLQQACSFRRAVAQCDNGDIHNNDNAPAAVGDNNGGHEVLLGLLENAINQQFQPDPPGQVPNDINNGNELDEDSGNLEQYADNDNNDYPNGMDGNHEHIPLMNNNNDYPVDMENNNVPNAPQDLREENRQVQLEIGGLLRAPSPQILEDHPMDVVGPEPDQVVPDFPLVDSSGLNHHPDTTQNPQQLADEMRELHDVDMVNNAEEDSFPQREDQQ